MKILSRYILRILTQNTLTVLLAFCALYALFDLLAQSSDVGRGKFTFALLVYYTVLHLPAYLYETFPVAVLTGALITLARLSSAGEFAVMLASGFSLKKFTGVLCVFAAVCAALTAFIGEWPMPAASDYADKMRHNALHGETANFGKQGVWLRNGSDMVEIGEVMPDGSLRRLTRYRIDENYRLYAVESAESAVHLQDDDWQLFQTAASYLKKDSVEVEHRARQIWENGIRPQLLQVLITDPAQMSVRYLAQYVGHLRDNGQRTLNYEVAMWRKIFYPAAAFAMVLLALAFTPAISRHSNLGLRIFGGMCLGVGFHFLARFFGFYAELFHMNAFAAGAMPVIVFVLLSFFVVWRYR